MRLSLAEHNRELGLQAARFVATGGVVAAFYVLATALLSKVVGLPFQVALPVAFCAAIALHFTLQRVVVWARGDYALPLHHQLGRYLGVAGIQYAITAAATATLPSRLGVSVFLVYLSATALVSIANFLIFRSRIFHGQQMGSGEVSSRPGFGAHL
jgi:putative flippase GtrA